MKWKLQINYGKNIKGGNIVTVNELVDKLIEVEQSLDTGTSQPRVLNDFALTEVQDTIRDIISELEQDGIDSNDGFRKVYQGGY